VPVAADASAVTDPKAKELVQNFQALESSNGLAFLIFQRTLTRGVTVGAIK
jgi:hypothetical protein